MLMLMGMWLFHDDTFRMGMQMVFIMRMDMGVDEKLMGMRVIMVLRQVQPDSSRDEHGSNPKQPGKRLPVEQN
jgi:hypothetical protein